MMKKTKMILVFHDAGEECDDQIALWKLSKELQENIETRSDSTQGSHELMSPGGTQSVLNQKIIAVMCGKTLEIQESRMKKWIPLCDQISISKNILNILLEDFKDMLNILTQSDSTPGIQSVFKDISHQYHYDAILQIAPLYGYDNEHITTDRYILMGSVDNSVNCPKGSNDLFRRFQGKPGTIVVESSEAAKVRPTKDFIKKVPQVLLDEMISVGFRLALCRCDPNQVYAEGLINKNVGRGANFETNQNMVRAIKTKWSPTTICTNPREDVNKYIQSLVNKSSDIEHTRQLLQIMYQNLDDIFGFNVPVIAGDEFDNFIKSEQGEKSYEKFASVALENPEILNPMYDYHAACVLIENLETDLIPKGSYS
jgi:hypothetical protein